MSEIAGNPKVFRKLVAILAADVAGYSCPGSLRVYRAVRRHLGASSEFGGERATNQFADH